MGEAYIVIEHPYDTRTVRTTHSTPSQPRSSTSLQAFILTTGTTHYRTIDRGATFASFDTPLPPALSASTLSFHSIKSDWILYTGTRCESGGGWKGRICHDEVSTIVV